MNANNGTHPNSTASQAGAPQQTAMLNASQETPGFNASAHTASQAYSAQQQWTPEAAYASCASPAQNGPVQQKGSVSKNEEAAHRADMRPFLGMRHAGRCDRRWALQCCKQQLATGRDAAKQHAATGRPRRVFGQCGRQRWHARRPQQWTRQPKRASRQRLCTKRAQRKRFGNRNQRFF